MSVQMAINKTKAIHHIKTSQHRAELGCNSTKGFHLQKLKNGGSWRYRFKLKGQPQKEIVLGRFVDGTKDRTDAESTAKKYQAMVLEGISPILSKEKTIQDGVKLQQDKKRKQKETISAYLDTNYTSHQARKKNAGKPTIDMIRRAFKDWLDKPMSELNRKMVVEWQANYEKTHAHDTCKRVYGALKTMLNHAVKSEIIEVNPLDKVQLEKPSHDEQQRKHSEETANNRRILSKDELRAINNGIELYKQKIIEGRESSRVHGKRHLPSFKNLAYPSWFFPFFRLAAYTGMRSGDLYNLEWHHISFDDCRLVKIPNKTQHHEKPVKLDIHLDNYIINVLLDWRDQQGYQKEGLVFPSPTTGRELSKDAHKKHWDHVMTLSELKEHLVFYSLRHHFISRLLEENVPLFTVARLAGHKTTAMIEKIYGKVSKDAANDALSTISNDFA
jgi:integrase